jgi:leucyl aminopeptidase
MKAGALLAVAQGSEEPPYLLRLSYKPKRVTNKKVIALVGKGVTFDSGGLSIKTGSGMETMKCDMSGAAAVIATMQAVATLKPGIEIRAYVPTTENMINGVATRPGDVVRAMSGKTIEILNTDAEGRLILADALHLAQQDKCDVIIDLATLTGACMVALGTDYAGLFSNNDGLTQRLQSAGDRAGERLWRMPLAKEYKNWIKSPVADIKNIGKSFGGAITAALFLEEFIGEVEWAHLDIAGPAFVDGESGYIKRGGVGFGVRTLLNYLRSL